MKQVRIFLLLVMVAIVGTVPSFAQTKVLGQDVEFKGIHLEAKRSVQVNKFFNFNDGRVRDYQANISGKFKINKKYTFSAKYSQRIENKYGAFSIAISRCVLFCGK